MTDPQVLGAVADELEERLETPLVVVLQLLLVRREAHAQGDLLAVLLEQVVQRRPPTAAAALHHGRLQVILRHPLCAARRRGHDSQWDDDERFRELIYLSVWTLSSRSYG